MKRPSFSTWPHTLLHHHLEIYLVELTEDNFIVYETYFCSKLSLFPILYHVVYAYYLSIAVLLIVSVNIHLVFVLISFSVST